MEATAFSVGKAVLDGALGYAKSFVAEEIALQLGVERDVAFIGDELEMMQAFLMTADEEQDKHKVLLSWVKQVRETAYNVEDSLMGFSLLSGKKPNCWCIPRGLWQRRNIAKEVKELRAKVEDVSNRNLRYRLIKDMGSKLTTAEEQASVASAAMFGINEARRAAVEQKKSKMGLRQLITNEEKGLKVIAVWGTSGDLGKTSAIMEVYGDPMINKTFRCRAWVTSMLPFNPKEFLENMVRQFYENSPEGSGGAQDATIVGPSVLMRMENMGLSDLVQVFSEKVCRNSFLVVIDNISTIMEWDCMKKYFPDNMRRSRIIVSTQQAEIATLCVDKPHQVSELKQLSSDQTLYLFHKKVTASVSTEPTSKTNKAPATGQHSATSDSEMQDDDEKPEDACRENASTSSAVRKFDRITTMALADEVVIGRDRETHDIIDLIGQPDNLQECKVISVWGMGGLGKTTLVRSIYRSQQLDGWKRAWVTASRPFNPEILIRSIYLQLRKAIQADPTLRSGTHQENNSISPVELQGLIQNLTHDLLPMHNCLIVIDDLSSIQEWDSIKENLANARWIIVTTRERGVAKHCSDKYVYGLERLKDDAALSLFKQKVFKGNTEKADSWCDDHDMMEQAVLLLKKCEGLPLAISTIGGFLATKPKTTTEWRKMNGRINVELELNPGLRTMKMVLMRSYDGLPYHLKSCFLYMSIFPEDHPIVRSRVKRRWIAEGYSREMHNMTASEVADRYFDELLDRSMILKGEAGNDWKVDSCHLHDMIREISVSRAREENLVFTLEEGCCLSSTQGAIRHLAISSNWKREKDVFERILDLSHIRSLTVFGEWRPFFISKRMRFLRVLDLEDTQGLEDHHLNQIGELIQLKYLSLRGCRKLCNLPNSVGNNLRNLQTLDIRYTGLRKLPTNIFSLPKLQFLHTTFSITVPRGIGKLNALCMLGIVEVDEKGKGTLKEFAQLYQLRKLEIRRITTANSQEFWSAIASLNHMRSLSVNWATPSPHDELDCSLGESLLPPQSIKSLKLGSPLVRFTEWIHHLQNLTRLQLCFTKLQQDSIQAIGKLPNIAVLCMRWGSFDGDELVFRPGYFPRLILLYLNLLGDVRFVKFEDRTTPELELLHIDVWNQLQELSGLRYLMKLKEIRLTNLQYCMEFKDNVQKQLAGNPNNVRWVVRTPYRGTAGD